jgi:hypothetical protein
MSPVSLSLPVASGDAGLFALLGGVLLLLCAALGLGITGVAKFFSKDEAQRRRAKRYLLGALLPLLIGAIWWVAFVGLD